MPTLTKSEMDDIRLLLRLELNSCFAKVSKKYADDPDDERRAFLETLFESIRECVEGDLGSDRKDPD
jgi:hypothetical protein